MTNLTIEVADTSIGIVLVALTDKGIRAVQIGDDALALESELASRFPGCSVAAASGEHSTAARVAEVVESPGSPFDLSLDIEGTDFQKSVWQALREIPPGTTVSYTELATVIGRPSAVRAVAHACAENAHAVLIPCHRAVRSDGSLAGYRWGLDRKRVLLEREATALACCTA